MSHSHFGIEDGTLNEIGSWMDVGGSVIGDVGGVIDSDRVSGGGDMIAGAGKLLHFDDKSGDWDPNYGGFGEVASGALQVMFGEAGAIAGTVPKVIASSMEAGRKASKLDGATGQDRLDAEHDMWGAAGDAALALAHATVGNANKKVDLAISGGELALDTLGGVAKLIGGEDAKFGAGDVVGGALEAVLEPSEQATMVADWTRDQFEDPTIGTLAGAATGSVAQMASIPMNLYMAGASGLVNTVGNMFDDDDDKRNDYFTPIMNEIKQDPAHVREWGMPIGASAGTEWTDMWAE